jgi:hypothetical protein
VSQTDVLSSINRRLAALKDYELGQSCTQEKVGRECYHDCAPTRVQSKGRKPLFEELRHCHISCWDVVETVCRPVYGKLTAREPFAIEKGPSVTLKEPNWSSIPGEILGYRETYTNCTSAQQSITFKHLETVRVGSRVTKTSSLQNSEKIEAKVEFKFENVFGGGTSIGFSRQVTVTNVDEENHEESRTLDFTVPLIVPAMTRVVLDHAWIRRVVPIQYSGTVQLDAGVNANRAGISRISQVITAPADRTFPFSGSVTNTLLVEGETSTVGTDLTKQQCEKRPGFERTPEPYSGTVR